MNRHRLAPRIALACLALALGLLTAMAARAAEPAPGGAAIRPCFVPAHPLKQGVKRPVPEPSARAGEAPVTLEGSPYAYHDDHLREGVQAAAGAPFPRHSRVIAILVDFDDQPMGEEFAAEAADSSRLYVDRAMLFLHQIYDEMSDGQFDLQWDVSPRVYRLPQSMAWYGLDDSIATREAALCRDAVRAADGDVDFSQYDRFMLFHAGAGQEADILDDSREQIWSVFFRQVDFEYYLDEPDAARGIRTGDVTALGDTVFVPNMVVCPETESQDGYTFGLMGTVAHEFGHSFGLPDLYDTTGPADFIYADSQGIGAFGLMGSGIWNDNGRFPAEMCAWSKFYVGWLRPRILRPGPEDGEQTVSLEAIALARRDGAVRIPMGGDEYLLIENRYRDYNGNGKFDFDDADTNGVFDFWTDSYGPDKDGNATELDWWLPQFTGPHDPARDGSGLLIWHVDESTISEWLLYNLVNAEALHKGVDLEEADGIQDLDKLVFTFEAFGDPRDAFWAPYSTEFTPNTVPNTDGYNDARTGIWITGISAPGPAMTFNLRFTPPGGTGPATSGPAGRGTWTAGWPTSSPWPGTWTATAGWRSPPGWWTPPATAGWRSWAPTAPPSSTRDPLRRRSPGAGSTPSRSWSTCTRERRTPRIILPSWCG